MGTHKMAPLQRQSTKQNQIAVQLHSILLFAKEHKSISMDTFPSGTRSLWVCDSVDTLTQNTRNAHRDHHQRHRQRRRERYQEGKRGVRERKERRRRKHFVSALVTHSSISCLHASMLSAVYPAERSTWRSAQGHCREHRREY